MIPQTLGALFAFLGLIAPGLLFELRREKRRPTIEETAFREASRVALTSLVFTLLSLAVLAVVRMQIPDWMPDPGLWLRRGHTYLNDHYRLIARALIVAILISLSFALLFDWLFAGRATGRIVSGSLWFHLFRTQRPKGTIPWIYVRLKNDTQFWGYLGQYTPEQKLENREISIVGPKLQTQQKGAGKVSLDNWASVAVRGDEISFMRVTYMDNRTGQVRHPTRPRKGRRSSRLLQRFRRSPSRTASPQQWDRVRRN
jgi:hypothetical protein